MVIAQVVGAIIASAVLYAIAAWPYCPINPALSDAALDALEYRPPPCHHDCGSDPGTGLGPWREASADAIPREIKKCHEINARVGFRSLPILQAIGLTIAASELLSHIAEEGLGVPLTSAYPTASKDIRDRVNA